MTEVYAALRVLDFEWKIINPYCIRARWAPAGSKRTLPGTGEVDPACYKVKLGLQLYKVEHGIFLLDFHKAWGDHFYFLELCAQIIIELQNSLGGRQSAKRLSSAAMTQPQVITGELWMHSTNQAHSLS